MLANNNTADLGKQGSTMEQALDAKRNQPAITDQYGYCTVKYFFFRFLQNSMSA